MSINNDFFQDEIFDTENFENSYYFPPVFSSSDDLCSDHLLDSNDVLSSDFLSTEISDSTDVFDKFRSDTFISPEIDFDSEFERMNPSGALSDLGANPVAQSVPVMTNQGYVQAYLTSQIGRYVTVEFLLGTSLLSDKSGLLTDVGINYIVLTDASRNRVMCDLYSIKFVTTATAVAPIPIAGAPQPNTASPATPR